MPFVKLPLHPGIVAIAVVVVALATVPGVAGQGGNPSHSAILAWLETLGGDHAGHDAAQATHDSGQTQGHADIVENVTDLQAQVAELRDLVEGAGGGGDPGARILGVEAQWARHRAAPHSGPEPANASLLMIRVTTPDGAPALGILQGNVTVTGATAPCPLQVHTFSGQANGNYFMAVTTASFCTWGVSGTEYMASIVVDAEGLQGSALAKMSIG